MPRTQLYERVLGRKAVSEDELTDFSFSTLRRLDNDSLFYITARTPEDHLHGRLCLFEIQRRSDTRATLALVLSVMSLLISLSGLLFGQAGPAK
jgi:hypothetical protein